VGSALLRHFRRQGFCDLRGASSTELDLRDRESVLALLAHDTPQVIVLAAARVGGILANSTYPADFLSDNLRIQTNVLDAAHAHGVERVLFLGSSCIYPRLAAQPIQEEYLLTGQLEPTNDAYAIAKIAGLVHVRAMRRQHGHRWISAMPTNLYGPGDNFEPKSGHVLAAMMRKFHDAKRRGGPVELWGSGTPRREFLHVDDLAAACLYLLDHYDGDSHINVGTGKDIAIRELAVLVADVVGYDGDVVWDGTKPDGTPRKLLDVSRLSSLGWSPSISLMEGIESTYAWFVDHHDELH
jgi:GDP-L-fucose synthase